MSLEVETRPEGMGMSSAQLEHLSRHLDAYVDDGRLPGVYCLVARQNKVVYLHHYGRRDIENDRPVELDTIYRFFSMSKPITSVATMQLYEQGRIK
ncbi:MAG: beta-lactamase family protein, partial [Acidimicrobiales bacterium]|nr:beta-lactamase family protein [Acidimicrobiales bacterium]